MYTTPQDCHSALETARAQARGLTRTLTATLAHMYPHAAYLVLSRCPDSGELHLDSLRTASGGQQHSFGESPDRLPDLTDPALRSAWGQFDPRDPQVLLRLLRDLDTLGVRFGFLPDSAQQPDDPAWDAPSLLCLVVNADAPEPEDREREVTVSVDLTVTEEVTYEFTAEVQLPAHLAHNPGALRAYLADNEELWLDDLDPLGATLSVNERSLDEASLTLAA
ncbi:hypothetical protein ACFQ8C_24885 [Streptomyces sp. NPDC056503]|uniref:hypothetical protein n=1 Tax=Streptomyces sp. NPDC056503 TaxID=3345842 RepID=UPI00367D10FA